MKYVVVAKRWSDSKQKIVTYIAEQFEECMNAEIFKRAYNEYYKTNAVIVEIEDITQIDLE